MVSTFRIGQGYDIHRLVAGRPLLLGGVPIDSPVGLLGHSDADIVLHALCDALLGAAGLGDIGEYFPDTDERFRGADSSVLLREVVSRLHAEGWEIGNVDVTIHAERPKLAPHRSAIVARLALLLGVSVEQVNVKAKTNERLDAIGRGAAMAASAIALIHQPAGR